MTGDSGGKKKGSGGSASNGFKALGLSEPVFHGIVRMGFRMPTPVQRKALPVILTGADACVMARTGSGKTIAFLVPLLEKLLKLNASRHQQAPQQSSCRAVILSPTRELSMQTLKVLHKLAHFADLRAVGIHGGEGMEKQFDMLASKPDIIVATPGRLAHHLTEIPDFDLTNCQMCILDEGDRCMEMGFSQQIRQIGRTMPENCQKIILSATMPKVLVEFTKSGFCTDPQVVRLDTECSVSEELRIAFLACRSSEKDAALMHVLHQIQEDLETNDALRTGLTIIFAATRHHVEYIHCLLQASGISSTLIYGTLDQDARKANLSAFRSGKKSVLVVTDVAARGIDVPLIDHVIHYHFPPEAKLFVHRSGRAARAGRIGFCWGLVDPEEMPYMVDLHLFLGRKPMNAPEGNDNLSYSLQEMTPEMVHYGSLPVSILTQEVENVHRIINSELAGSLETESLQSLARVCNNAMKQYRRTRPEASKDGVRRAKAIMEGARLESGQRIGQGRIPTHPLLRDTEEKVYLATVKGADDEDKEQTLSNFHDHESMLQEIAAFRPKETVFEAFATGVGKDVGVASQVDRGRTTNTKKNNSTAALFAMKNMRRQMKTVRSKGTALVVAGSSTAQKLNQDEEEPAESEHKDASDAGGKSVDKSSNKVDQASGSTPEIRRPKKFLSKAERRKLAKAKKSGGNTSNAEAPTSITSNKPKKQQTDFRDPAFYIDNDLTSNTEEAHRARKIEAAMQPSAGMKGIIGAAFRIEEAMLDVVGDENEELVQKQRMTRWDKSKRKYVQTTVGDELRGESKSKKTRLESGQLVATEKMKLGELYAKWQKKTNRSIGRTGVFDSSEGPSTSEQYNSREAKGKQGAVKSAVEIKKEREKKQNMKIKNMKKEDRRRLEQKQKRGQGKSNDVGRQKPQGKKRR
ncbi:dependent RNA helicase [Seminavis robusta]|uniref:RNA helicase n=1 Tax=Seminavis robusta TaxID=568900 RepID=A0A9N8HTE7_9STRA|nr:dependent RNA helicase [Seminavis robusta]|eukprot:Sro1505_g278170.1 dependent RNA helicase (918) ;mRNA; r:6532-9583